jgi:hypothetical protein
MGSDALKRIIADNDVRNGSVAARLIRMSEHPEREPDANGLYRDEYSAPCDSKQAA